MPHFFLRTLWFSVLALACCAVMAKDCGGQADPCGQLRGWNEFETVRLRMKQSGVDTPAQWVMQTRQHIPSDEF